MNSWLTTHESAVNELPPVVLHSMETVRSHCLSLDNTSEKWNKHVVLYHIKGTVSRDYFAGMIYGYNGVLFLTQISNHKKSFPLCCCNDQHQSRIKNITICEAKNLTNMCYHSACVEAKRFP